MDCYTKTRLFLQNDYDFSNNFSHFCLSGAFFAFFDEIFSSELQICVRDLSEQIEECQNLDTMAKILKDYPAYFELSKSVNFATSENLALLETAEFTEKFDLYEQFLHDNENKFRAKITEFEVKFPAALRNLSEKIIPNLSDLNEDDAGFMDLADKFLTLSPVLSAFGANLDETAVIKIQKIARRFEKIKKFSAFMEFVETYEETLNLELPKLKKEINKKLFSQKSKIVDKKGKIIQNLRILEGNQGE